MCYTGVSICKNNTGKISAFQHAYIIQQQNEMLNHYHHHCPKVRERGEQRYRGNKNIKVLILSDLDNGHIGFVVHTC